MCIVICGLYILIVLVSVPVIDCTLCPRVFLLHHKKRKEKNTFRVYENTCKTPHSSLIGVLGDMMLVAEWLARRQEPALLVAVEQPV